MKKRLKAIISSILVPILLLSGTAAIFFFSKGYRFNFRDGEIERTGVISVKTAPRRASVYIDTILSGTSPRAFDGLVEGTHSVRVTKEGYYDWKTTVTVESEQLIPFEITLFLKKPIKEALFPSQEEPGQLSTVNLLSSNANATKAVFAVLRTPAQVTESAPPTTVVSTPISPTIQIWSFQLLRRFWETEAIPVLIGEFSTEALGVDVQKNDEYSIELLPSPNGEQVIFSFRPINTTISPQYYLLNTGLMNSTPSALTQLIGSDSIAWNQNSQHILYKKANELRSLNISNLILTVISELPQNEQYFWTTNDTGTIFIVKKTDASTQLLSSRPDGGTITTLLDFPVETSKSEAEATDTPANQQEEDNQTEGQTEKVKVSDLLLIATAIRPTPDNTKLILFSPESIALYSLNTNTLDVFPASNPSFISFSPDQNTFLFKDKNQSFYEFWFLLEDRDPLHQIGPRILIDGTQDTVVNAMTWHPSSHVVIYSKKSDETTDIMLALDTENRQSYKIASIPAGASFVPDGSGKKIVAECEASALCVFTTQK